MLKVYSIVEPDGFLEVCNLRAGKNHNLSYSSNDVSWSHLEGNVIATAATNGVVSVFDLARFGRQKQLLTYNEHERTAHSVSFHKTEPHFLISCSQDGTLKRFDTRHEKSVTTFYSNAESVRDVKFCPGNPYIFAAALENGQVQLWDTRRADRCTSQFTAHSEPIYTCDWHPTHPSWLATGSRDKQIKIWSIGTGDIDPVFTIQTIAVVGRVRWRPEKTFQLGSAALVMDYSIYIWDVRRPFIPYASFNEHTNVTTDIAFKDPYSLLSTSKDSTIYRHSLRDANRSSMNANPQGASINFRGDLVFANKLKCLPPAEPELQTKGEKRDHFHLAKSSLFTFPSCSHEEDSPSFREYVALKGFATEYLLTGPLAEVCDHNGKVAKRYSKPNLVLLWKWVKHFFGSSSEDDTALENSEGSANSDRHPTSAIQMMNRRNKLSSTSGIGWGEDQLPDRGLTHHTHQSHDEKTFKNMEHQLLPKNMETAKSASNWTGSVTEGETAGDFILFGERERELTIDCVNLLRNGFLYTGDICKEIVFPALACSNDLSATKQNTELPQEAGSEVGRECSAIKNNLILLHSNGFRFLQRNQNLLKVSIAPNPPALWEPYQVLSDCLFMQAEIGDVQTICCVLIALGSHKRSKLSISEVDHENWLLSYIEQLHKHQLWNEAAEIINYSWISNIGAINEQSTAVHTNCGVCLKPMSSREGGYYCTKCKSSDTSKCSVCEEVVRGIYSWCGVCSHGGHIRHIQEWFSRTSKCPTCGHLCELD